MKTQTVAAVCALRVNPKASSAQTSIWETAGAYSGDKVVKTCQPAADYSNEPFCEWLMHNNWESDYES